MNKPSAKLDQAEGELIVAALIGMTADVPPDAKREIDALVGSIIRKLGLVNHMKLLFDAAKAAKREAEREG